MKNYSTAEASRLQESDAAKLLGKTGDPTSVNASGGRFARITATTAQPGSISVMIKPGRVPITGARTGSPASAMTASFSVSL